MSDPALRFMSDLPSRELLPLARIIGLVPDHVLVREDAHAWHPPVASQVQSAVLRMGQGRFSSTAPTYREIVLAAAVPLKIPGAADLPTPEIEQAIVRQLLRRLDERLTLEEKENLAIALEQKFGSEVRGLRTAIVGGGGLLAANAAGFSLYIGASTLVGAITGALGITLPFAFYTTLSSILSVAIGPLGWVALGAVVLYKIGKPPYKTMLATVMEVTRLREMHSAGGTSSSDGSEPRVGDSQ